MKNLSIPLLPAIVEDLVQAEAVEFKQDKRRLIIKQEKPLTERDRLKEKMKKMNRNFR